MDNRLMDIRGGCVAGLRLAVELAMLGSPSKTVTHFVDNPQHGLVLLWHVEPDAVPLPVPLNHVSAVSVVREWLSAQPGERYIDRLDHDGDNGEGWRVYNEEWGHVGPYRYAVFAVQPCWAWYGK
jgi:hypothetical protein